MNVLHASPLRVIVGPTAAGKSDVALRLAARHRAGIVSADSRQIYRGFDIGTAKPTVAERAAVPHAGIDVADPEERFSAARWAAMAGAAMAAAARDGGASVVVGGTGFYVRALVDPLAAAPSLDPARRARLEAVTAHWSLDELRRWVRALDPARAQLGRAQLLRAVETALLTGRRLSDAHRAHVARAHRDTRYLLVDPGRAVLLERIAQRADAMLDGGWPEEVAGLMERVPADAPAWNASGYEAVRRLVRGEIGRAAALQAVIVATRQYAKRQRTWFRHQLPPGQVTLLDPAARDADERIGAWWAGAPLADAASVVRLSSTHLQHAERDT